MKKMFFLLGCIAIGLNAKGQGKVYIMPTAGIGLSNVSQDYNKDQFHDLNKSGIMNYNIQVGVGYCLGKWRIETGLQYLVSGFKHTGLLFGNSYPNGSANGFIEYKYLHLNVPLQVGYTIPVSAKFSFVPMVGMALGYNMDEHITVDYDEVRYTNNMGRQAFKSIYNTISVWTKTGVRLEYKINNRFQLIGGPNFQYMLTNLYKVPDNVVYEAAQHNYSLNFDLGLKVSI
jgi:hypothetical protein